MQKSFVSKSEYRQKETISKCLDEQFKFFANGVTSLFKVMNRI